MTALAWTDDEFTLSPYDLVFLPGGHEKSVVQVINSPITHKLIADYFPQTRKPSKKNVAAICHGVMVLSESSLPDGKSVLHDATTTALPGFMEQSIFWGTRLFLGDYYKTYGAGSESVQTSVSLFMYSKARCCLTRPIHKGGETVSRPQEAVLQQPLVHSVSMRRATFRLGFANLCSFIREDENYNYISGRFPPDAKLLAEKTIALVNSTVA